MTPVHTDASESIELLYVDPDFVVANKPSGLLVHRGLAADRDNALVRVRDALGEYVYPVHRLDRGTSGAILFARNRESAAQLAQLLEAGAMTKTYVALVRGEPVPAQGVIDYAIPKDEGGERVSAITEYRLLRRSPRERCSLVEARPLTGRYHQVRRHLRHLGHPLIGDVKYGSGELNRKYRSEYALHRLALHAASLGFEHPRLGTPVSVRAPVPPELEQALDRLGTPYP